MTYTYYVEDGQFSVEFDHDQLLGQEGDIRYFYYNGDYRIDFYILWINGKYIHCIGNFEREFPKDIMDHHRLKDIAIELFEKYNAH